MRKVLIVVGGMVALWAAALGLLWSGAFFFPGTPLGLVIGGVAWALLAAVVAVLGWAGHRWWLGVLGAVVTVLLAVPLYNWSAAAPATYFEAHRSLYDRAVRTTDTDDSYYGAKLPLVLQSLSANGRVRAEGGTLFFPQWLGIPDDAGGYLWSPDRSPAGAEMFGTVCVDPADLGDGWWMCLM